jgi:hypothetical protein
MGGGEVHETDDQVLAENMTKEQHTPLPPSFPQPRAPFPPSHPLGVHMAQLWMAVQKDTIIGFGGHDSKGPFHYWFKSFHFKIDFTTS